MKYHSCRTDGILILIFHDSAQHLISKVQILCIAYCRRQNQAGNTVFDRRVIGSISPAVFDIGDICHDLFIRFPKTKSALQHILFPVPLKQFSGCLPGFLRCSDRTQQSGLSHQPLNFLAVHDRLLQLRHHHGHHAGSFRISAVFDHFPDPFNVFFVLQLFSVRNIVSQTIEARVAEAEGSADTADRESSDVREGFHLIMNEITHFPESLRRSNTKAFS